MTRPPRSPESAERPWRAGPATPRPLSGPPPPGARVRRSLRAGAALLLVPLVLGGLLVWATGIESNPDNLPLLGLLLVLAWGLLSALHYTVSALLDRKDDE